MATLADAKNVLRGFKGEVIEREDGDFQLNLRSRAAIVHNIDIDEYLLESEKLKFNSETAAFRPGYYEHAVQFEGEGPRRIRRGEDDLQTESPDGLTKIEISRPSARFVLSISDNDEIDRSLRRLAFPMMTSRQVSIRDFFRIYTIKVSTDVSSALGKNVAKMHDLAEAAIFHFGYGKGLAVSFTRSWERTYYWVGRKSSETVQFPKRTYNSELVSYYNLALSTDSLVLGYLALYKILEYFYTAVSESSLHKILADQLVSPDFSHTKAKKLREIIKTIRKFDNKQDELSALKLVLSTYFTVDEFRDWINKYEIENGVYFTQANTVFSHQLRIDLSDNSIFSNTANRIYTIRNALVHNKEGEVARFVPYTGQEEALQKEVQILLFLAEQIIIKTGKDI